MPLRNVATTYTIEQQRLEINLLAGDVNNIATGSTSTTASSLAAGATGADLTLSGTLTVNGTQTILNTATLEVEDKNIVIAKGATTDAAANSGGITLKGANDKTITYSSTGDKWVSNKDFEAPNLIGAFDASQLTGTLPAIDGSALTGISVDSTKIETGNTKVETVDTGSDGHIKFTTEGTERLRITQDAGLTKFIQGATTTTSNTIFHVEGSSAVGAEFIGNNTQQGFYLALQNKNTNTDAWTAIQSWDAGGQGVSSIRFIQVNNDNNQGAIAFRTRDGSAGEQERLLIGSDGTIKIPAVSGTNTNADLAVLFQTSAGVIDGGSGLTYNPGGDTLKVNGLTISQGGINGNAASLNLSCANHSSTCSINVGSVITTKADILPSVDDTDNLGSANKRWANVYTGDMHLNNTGSGGNEVDGSEGHWTMQEGSDDLFLINRNTGKKYKFNLTEVS